MPLGADAPGAGKRPNIHEMLGGAGSATVR
jgi:hypothetical protein